MSALRCGDDARMRASREMVIRMDSSMSSGFLVSRLAIQLGEGGRLPSWGSTLKRFECGAFYVTGVRTGAKARGLTRQRPTESNDLKY